ncbi:MAG TPA: endopeptidase La [bacterium]|nr:endopeptidase La [bacterium]HPS31129.1 endopeptidase La [bacterium]
MVNENNEIKPIPDILPVLPLKDSVLFPYMILNVNVQRGFSALAVNRAITGEGFLIVTAQKDAASEEISDKSLYLTGTVATIIRMQKSFDGSMTLLIQGSKKASLSDVAFDSEGNYYKAHVAVIEETDDSQNILAQALMVEIKNQIKMIADRGEISLPPEALGAIQSVKNPGRLAEIILNHLSKSIELSQRVLEENSQVRKLQIVHENLEKEINLLEIQSDIRNKAKERLGKAQKEYYLKEQMKQIQKELGNDDPHLSEIQAYEKKLAETNLPENVKSEATKQLDRLRTMNPAASETVVIKTWLDTILELPWNSETPDNKDITKAGKILEDDHFGLEDVKERILEFLAVRQIRGTSKSPILCFIGPPGVGKTSLGKSIARALGRKFYRLSLGGLHDEAEIRGHRRTYIGAMPGKIIEGIKTSGAMNPVFMLDEIDKVGKDFRGDPSSALLEVLDPEQNFSFLDNYIGIPFDLSKVFFIATANWEETIPAPLKDRMEVIRLSGYTDPERLEIAKKYLIPRQLENCGLNKKDLSFSKEALLFISRRYTRESGVRNLERNIGSICRKVTTLKVQKKETPKLITPKVAEKYLKLPPFSDTELDYEGRIGVITGLAWTQFGGSTLKIEANWMKGKGGLILTGQLGDIMKESARIALSFIQSNAETFGLGPDFTIENKDIHIHFPAGAIPKDGPSAGITITTALLSLFLKKEIDPLIAMTGEISLTGEVLPIGGLKEKLLAAGRNKVTEVFMPEKNRALYESISPEIKGGIKVHFVSEYIEVFKRLFKK